MRLPYSGAAAWLQSLPKTRPNILAFVVPGIGLSLLAMMTMLYLLDYEWYMHLFFGLGFIPYKYPFLDWEGVSAAVKCWNKGINVYRVNPCDPLGRLHDYSPLWLRATFIPYGARWRNMIGLGLVISFFVSLSVVFRPRSWKEVLIFALAATSSATVYVLERANIDVLVFLFLVTAGISGTGALRSRMASYAFILFAGLLKFYPLVALLSALRERPRVFIAIATLSFGVILLGLFYYGDEIEAIIKIIPHGSYDSVFFGASNLPSGLATIISGKFFSSGQSKAVAASFAAIQMAFFALLILGVAVQAIWVSRSAALARAYLETPDREKLLLVIGASLVAGFFFAGQNIGYRGVFLLFVVAGLIAMCRNADDDSTRTGLRRLISIVLLLMWGDGLHHWFAKIAGPFAQTMFWLVRELLWWQLAAMLVALILVFAFHSSTIITTRAWLAASKPARLAQD